MRDERCETCRFFEDHGNYGDCRRYPPSQSRDGGVTHRFPILARYAWCGEFKRKPQPARPKRIPTMVGWVW